jgi:tetratricopeptide (TPR) repeat protein
VKPISIVTMLMLMLSGCGSFGGGNRVLTPRENAASQLTLQGTQLLNAGKTDNAIRLFEQAIGLNPTHGPSYYHMAQAWLAKGKFNEARRFNNVARGYLENDPGWANRVDRQTDQIERLAHQSIQRK